jgi:hypothetical protein
MGHHITYQHDVAGALSPHGVESPCLYWSITELSWTGFGLHFSWGAHQKSLRDARFLEACAAERKTIFFITGRGMEHWPP